MIGIAWGMNTRWGDSAGHTFIKNRKPPTRYESPFARVFTSNSRKREYWQPPILLIAHREEPHNLENDYYEEEPVGASVISRTAGILLSIFLMKGGWGTAFNPQELSREIRGQEVLFSAEVDVASGLLCLTLGAFLFWFCTRNFWNSLGVRIKNRKLLPPANQKESNAAHKQ